ncbi:MAG: DUF4890 domain-containing protein [Prevotella sp.]|nr:DUF4890 domain-containing protein [Prevotella sp.]
MKKMVLTFVALMTLTCVSAQTEGNRRDRDNVRPDRTEWMVKELGLDAAQTEKVKALNDKYPELQRRGRGFRPGMQPGMQPQGGGGQFQGGQRPSREDMEKMFAERRAKMEAYNKELKEILTEDQYKAYEKRQEEMRKNRPQRPMGNPQF